MATKPPRPIESSLSPRVLVSLVVLHAMVENIAYELLDQGNGEVAENLVRRAVEIGDKLLEATS